MFGDGNPKHSVAQCVFGALFNFFLACDSITRFSISSLSDQDSFDKALRDAGSKLVVVDFTATWCGPCKMIAPYYKELSDNPQNSNVVFLKVDVDDAQDVAAHCEIKCMPTFHFYKNGKKIDEFSGGNRDKLVEILNKHK
ncbi:thioredoxin-like [Astyanax mexicanus]|uniref:Thioredoxin-like n=1 Tax=Astyanax mexicanus TaxID=7994 RepID=A0A8T2M0B7_ASTMX|nr:thioredoxin-like [Astyanax mexicanus]